jgi:hypothetical protein
MINEIVRFRVAGRQMLSGGRTVLVNDIVDIQLLSESENFRVFRVRPVPFQDGRCKIVMDREIFCLWGEYDHELVRIVMDGGIPYLEQLIQEANAA